jgi:uncharacterized membrane protein/rubrerythrin
MMNLQHLHPLSVHFPVALIIVGLLFDVVSLFFKKDKCLSRAGFILMILGCLGAVGAYLTGEYFSRSLEGPLGEKKEYHELFAKITMWVMVGTTALRILLVALKKDQGGLKWLVLVLFLGGAGLVSYTGLLGGSLVYDYLLDEPVTETPVVKDSLKTTDNLIEAYHDADALTVMFTCFAKTAEQEQLKSASALFSSLSASFGVHARKYREALLKRGLQAESFKVDFDPGTTVGNLDKSISILRNETDSLLPASIAIADKEKEEDASMDFQSNLEVYNACIGLLTQAREAISDKKAGALPSSYSVCPKCGLIYDTKMLSDFCDICGTEKARFQEFKS